MNRLVFTDDDVKRLNLLKSMCQQRQRTNATKKTTEQMDAWVGDHLNAFGEWLEDL